MNVRVLKAFCLLSVFFLMGSDRACAQNLTGIWRGYFVTDGFDQYKFEVQIEENGSKSLGGVSYSYLTTVFYGKAKLTGHFNPSTGTAMIQEVKTIELRMSGSSVACIMKLLVNYSKSGKEEFLEGTYTSKYEKAEKQFGIQQGAGCGGGKVFLRKVPTSDFYVEPFLRDNPTVRKPPAQTPATPPPSDHTNKPPVTKPPIARTIPPSTTPRTTTPQKPVTKPPVNKPVVTAPKKDTVGKVTPQPKVETPRATPPPVKVPEVTRSRTNELLQTVTVRNEEVVVRLYDNGEIDDDTISVYMDNQLVLGNKRLTASPLTITLRMDEQNPEHILVMVAENLGRIPPNTSLMIVQDGDRRYQVRITSTEQKNAAVRFRYQKE